MCVQSPDDRFDLFNFFLVFSELVSSPCTTVELIAVVAPSDALAQSRKPVRDEELCEHTDIVLSEPSNGKSPTKASPSLGKRWRINDSEVRYQLVRAGLGWARLPRHQVEDDLRQKTLVRLATKRYGRKNTSIELHTIYRREHPPGPAGRWFLKRVAANTTP